MRATRMPAVLKLAVLVGALAVLPACEKAGKTCDRCSTSSDCEAGLICDRFEGGRNLCASPSTQSCLVANPAVDQ